MHLKQIYLKTVDSTQTYAKETLAPLKPETLYVIRAEEQTAGYGTRKRSWLSPASNNLYLTLAFHKSPTPENLTDLATLIAKTLQTLLKEEGIPCELKYPNDLLLQGKKIAGVLCETQFTPKGVDLFIGIGLNLQASKEECSQVDQPATSIFLEMGLCLDPDTLTTKLIEKLKKL